MGARFGIAGLAGLLSLTGGCAIIDGLSGDGGKLCESAFDSDCQGSTCIDTTDLGPAPISRSVPTCESMSFAFDLDPLCGSIPDPGAARTAVFRFQVISTGEFEICATSDDGFAGAKMMISETCEQTPFVAMCLSGGSGCLTAFLGSGPHFLYYQEPNENTCPDIDLNVRPMGTGEPEIDCLDGFDNDADGFQDCEDPDCQTTFECDVNAFGDPCNGVEDFTDVNFFPPGLVDEGGCACTDDGGCDSLQGVGSPSYLCNVDPNGSNPGLCMPRCDNPMAPDWCLQLTGFQCSPDGRCDTGMPPF